MKKKEKLYIADILKTESFLYTINQGVDQRKYLK